jgi:urea transporter
MKALIDEMLRGFSRLLMVEHRGTGLCVLAGLACLSVGTALLSFTGALVVSAVARWRSRDMDLRESGLLAVNGVLLGVLWLLLPHVTVWPRVLGVVAGGGLIAWFAPPSSSRLVTGSRVAAWELPGLPAGIMAWISLLLLQIGGFHDAELSAGMRALAAGRFEEAEKHFLGTAVRSDLAEAHRCAGLGWSLHRRGDQAGAQVAFSRALSLDTGIAAAFDGLGWSRLRQGRVDEAALAFRRAVSVDGFHHTARAGLASCALEAGHREEALHHFTMAALCAPFSAPAFAGLAAALPEGHDMIRRAALAWSGILTRHAPPGIGSVSMRVLLCGLCFVIGAWWSARGSAGMLVAAAVSCAACSTWLQARLDPMLFCNIAGLFLVSGPPRWRKCLALLPATAFFTIAHAPLEEWLLSAALLPLLLPFHLALLATRLVPGLVRGLTGPRPAPASP